MLFALGAFSTACSLFVPFDDYERESCSKADLRTDPKHCGACGHDCLGKACTDGLCEPETILVEQTPQPNFALTHLTVDASTLYFGYPNVGAIGRAPKTSFNSVSAFATVPGFDSFAGTTETDVYWRRGDATGPAIGRLSKARTGDAILELPAAPEDIQPDDARVYFVDRTGTGTVFSVDAALATTPVMIVRDVYTFTLDAMFLFVSDKETLRRVAKDGSEPTILASGQRNAITLVTDDTYLYWCNVDPPASPCFRISKGGGTPEKLVEGSEARGAYAVNGSFVFGATVVDNAEPERQVFLWRLPKAGGREVPLTAKLRATDLSIDDTYVYWSGTEGVFRVPK